MLPVISKFYNQILEDKDGHRYRSWEHCYNAFGNSNLSTENLSLHLAFYLASWGMYRGSSGLLWKDYTVHSGAVDIIKCFPEIRVSKENLFPDSQKIWGCVSELKEYYSNIEFYNNKALKKITATDTLLTKIILGGTGSIPAFDRYFLAGTSHTLKISSFDQKNIKALYNYALENENEIKLCQSFIAEKSGLWYPPMKIIDMFFWQIGFEVNLSQTSKFPTAL